MDKKFINILIKIILKKTYIIMYTNALLKLNFLNIKNTYILISHLSTNHTFVCTVIFTVTTMANQSAIFLYTYCGIFVFLRILPNITDSFFITDKNLKLYVKEKAIRDYSLVLIFICFI